MARKPKGHLAVVKNDAPAAGPGHNAAAAEEQAKRLHFQSHVPSYERALQAKKDADAHFKNVCKTIKSEGGDIDSVKLTIKLKTPEGEKQFKETLEKQRRIAEWNNLPIGQQGWLLDNDPRPLEEKAFADGEYAGLNNGDPKPPYAPGPVADAWMKGWHHSQSKLAEGFTKTPDAEIIRKPDAQASETKPDEFDAAETSQESTESSGKSWPDDEQVGKSK